MQDPPSDGSRQDGQSAHNPDPSDEGGLCHVKESSPARHVSLVSSDIEQSHWADTNPSSPRTAQSVDSRTPQWADMRPPGAAQGLGEIALSRGDVLILRGACACMYRQIPDPI
jgi:hypothetical protein